MGGANELAGHLVGGMAQTLLQLQLLPFLGRLVAQASRGTGKGGGAGRRCELGPAATVPVAPPPPPRMACVHCTHMLPAPRCSLAKLAASCMHTVHTGLCTCACMCACSWRTCDLAGGDLAYG